jgi:hypothetical protein
MSLKNLKLSSIDFNYEVEYVNTFESNKVVISKICSVKCERYSVTVNAKEWFIKASKVKPIQQIWPDMSTDDREFLISALTPAEWDSLYGDAYGNYVENLNK